MKGKNQCETCQIYKESAHILHQQAILKTVKYIGILTFTAVLCLFFGNGWPCLALGLLFLL